MILTRRELFRLGMLTGGTILVDGWGGVGSPAPAAQAASAATGGPKRGGQLKVGMSGDLAIFEPTVQLQPNIPLLFNLFDTPTQYDKQMRPQPYLATSWELTSDGLSVKMNLRRGVKFHSGRELTAEDVNFSLKRAQDPKVGALYKFMADKVTVAEAPDPYTVLWRFKSANPGVFDLMSKLHVVDKENIDKADFTKRGVGSGPFVFARFAANDHVLLKRNPNYWRQGLPYLDEVLIRMFPDPQAAVLSLEAGAIDVLSFMPLVDAARLQNSAKIKVSQGPVRAVYDILMTTKHKPFSEKKVRQAVNNTVNREQYWKSFFGGFGDWTSIPFPSQSAAYFADLAKSVKPNLEKAKQLMGEAGYPNGFETVITTSKQAQKEHLDIAVLYQQDLARIGIKARIEDIELAQYNRRVIAGEIETAVHAYARANYDPDTLFGGARAWTPSIGFTKFGEDEYVRLINDAASSYNMDERKPKYRKLLEYIIDQSFTLPICYNPEMYAHHADVKGMATDADYNTDFSEAWLDR
jgi:peptide/nickel transport system substrate-binding protein